MYVDFADSFEVQAEATATKMVREKLDVCEIPGAKGMVLVRVGSTEHRSRRAKSHPSVVIVPVPVVVDGNHFFVCEC